MKQTKKRWLGLAIVPLLLALMSVASPAYATDYTCDGGSNPVPENVTGTVNIALISENCVIDHDVTATSLITIQTTAFAGAGSIKTKKLTSINSDIIVKAPNNSITTKQIKAGWNVNIEGGTITVDGSITGHTDQTSANHFPADPSYHGSILLRALGNISTKTIRMEGGLGHASVKSGGIQIDANMSGAPVEFLIGGPSANGVDGDLITISSIGCNTIPTHMEGGVRITNGLSTSQGGIRLIDMSNIKVRSTQSRAGLIILNAQNGTLTLPTGKLNAEGMPGQMGGYIFLAGKTIDMQDGTIISTNQDADAAASDHHINITAETIKFRGTEGLKVLADGNGLTGYGLVYIAPQNAVFSRSNNQLNGLDWTFDYLSSNGPLKLDGTGDGTDTAPLLVRADGNGTEVFVAGYPINFIGGDVTLRARGATEHNIYLGYLGAFTNKQGMEVSITGNFVLDADGQDGDGGMVRVSTDQTLLNASNKHIFRADGEPSGGNGGSVNIKYGSVVLISKATISANGAELGIGNALSSPLDSTGPQAVVFQPGANAIWLGTGTGDFNISATSGALGGNAGTVRLRPSVPSSGSVFIRNQLSVNARALADQGNGGTIELNSSLVEFSGDDLALDARGGIESGEGGRVILPNVVGPNDTNYNINTEVKVDSGAQESAFGGSITLNGLLCQRWKTEGEATFPLTFWDCNTLSNPSSFYQPALALHQSMKNLLKDKVDLFAFADSGIAYPTYFNVLLNPDYGFSVVTPPPKLTSVFYQNGSDDLTSEVPYTLMHELGHQLDFLYGSGTPLSAPSQSNVNWLAAVEADKIAFNQLPCISVIDANLPANTANKFKCGHSSNVGKTNWELVDKFMNNRASDSPKTKREHWAVAFGYAYQPSNSQFELRIQALLVNENQFMAQLKANGAP